MPFFSQNKIVFVPFVVVYIVVRMLANDYTNKNERISFCDHYRQQLHELKPDYCIALIQKQIPQKEFKLCRFLIIFVVVVVVLCSPMVSLCLIFLLLLLTICLKVKLNFLDLLFSFIFLLACAFVVCVFFEWL